MAVPPGGTPSRKCRDTPNMAPGGARAARPPRWGFRGLTPCLLYSFSNNRAERAEERINPLGFTQNNPGTRPRTLCTFRSGKNAISQRTSLHPGTSHYVKTPPKKNAVVRTGTLSKETPTHTNDDADAYSANAEQKKPSHCAELLYAGSFRLPLRGTAGASLLDDPPTLYPSDLNPTVRWSAQPRTPRILHEVSCIPRPRQRPSF